MKRVLTMIASGALIALLALGFADSALAQGPRGQGAPGRAGQQTRVGGPAQSLVGMAATQLGIPQAELVAQLRAGATIADALTAGGVNPASFIDSFVATRAERLNAAVAAGRLTRAEADAQLATARSLATARIYQPFTSRGPGGQGPQAGQGQGRSAGPGFVDADGDGVCDNLPAAGQARMGGGRGPRR